MSAAGPDIASLLASIGAGGAPPTTTSDPGAEAPPDADPTATSTDPLDLLRQMIDDGQQYMQEEPHEQHKSIVAQCIAQLQKILGQDEKETQDAMSGKVAPRQLQRAASSQAGYQ